MNRIQNLPMNRPNAGKSPAGSLSLHRAQGMKSTEVIEPDLVILRNVVEDSDCEKTARTALEWGRQGEAGFYTSDDKCPANALYRRKGSWPNLRCHHSIPNLGR
jgi:hypothetical protein